MLLLLRNSDVHLPSWVGDTDKNFRAFDGSMTTKFCIKIRQLGFEKEMLQLHGQSKQQMRGKTIYCDNMLMCSTTF